MSTELTPRPDRGTVPELTTLAIWLGTMVPLLAYVTRVLSDTMCTHGPAGFSTTGYPQAICDRCQRYLQEVVVLAKGSAAEVADWTPARLAELQARIAIKAARRLIDMVAEGEPLPWSHREGTVIITARQALDAASNLIDNPELGGHMAARSAADAARELDQVAHKSARKRGTAESVAMIGHVLKAASKAAESAVYAIDVKWSMHADAAGDWVPEAFKDRPEMAANAAGASIGAALDGAGAFRDEWRDPQRATALMAVGMAAAAEFHAIVHPDRDDVAPACAWCGAIAAPLGDLCIECAKEKADEEYTAAAELATAAATGDTPNVPCENSTSQGDPVDAPTEPLDVAALLAEDDRDVNDFDESELGDVADEAIGDAAELLADLERAERILTALAAEHRPVEAWTRRRGPSDADIQYRTQCCLSCRDGDGQPVPSPCRTAKIIGNFGEA